MSDLLYTKNKHCLVYMIGYVIKTQVCHIYFKYTFYVQK